MAAAQAVLCAVLLLVVYLTLLRPESEDALPRAVDAEQGRELEVYGSFPGSRDRRDAGARSRRDGETRPGPELVGEQAAIGEDVGASAQGEPTEPPPGGYTGPAAVELEEQSPSDDQYEDAVSGLLDRVRAAD